jgi:hypothetical protein
MHLPDDMMDRKQQGHNMGEVEYRIAWAKSLSFPLLDSR